MDLLQELCKGEVLRGITCETIIGECLEINQSNQELRHVEREQSSLHFLPTVYRKEECCEREATSFLELLLDLVIKLDFPEKLVTFLLQLLPNQEYKVQYLLIMMSLLDISV